MQQEFVLRTLEERTFVLPFRLVMKEVGIEQGSYATFIPKPFTEHPGSGMHSHMSLFEGDRNAFYEPVAELQRPKIHNRSALVRLTMRKPHKGNATRVESRSIDAACNPNLAYALILAAGLKGIENHYDLPPPADDDVSHGARPEMDH